MNDLERDLREVFHEDARRVTAPATAPAGLRRSARRRQVVFGGAVALAGLAIVAGVVAGATTLLSGRGGPEPAVEGPKTTGTLNGVTITYPEAWHLIDPDTAGLNGSPTMGESPLPRIVLALAPTQVPETFGCPARTAGGDAAPLVMTIQEEPLALDGPASTPWPAELQPMSVDTSEAGCYPDWEFLRAGWTASGRTFEARVGFSPDASNDERDALFAAFASMTFEPSSGDATSVVLAHGTAGGEDWQLIAARQTDGLSLSLDARTFGTGAGGYDPTSNKLILTSHVFGEGAEAERVVFAAVPSDVVSIVGATRVSAEYPEVLDVPDRIDSDLDAFVLVVDVGTDIAFEGFNASDDLVVSGGLDSSGNPLEQAHPQADEVLFNGRTNDCFWTLTRTTEDPATERVQLWSPLGDLLTEIEANVGADASPIQLSSYRCPIGQGGTLVFGLVTDEVANLRWPTTPLDENGRPECWPGKFPAGFCLFVLDGVGDAGEAIAFDANDKEIGRASFG
ncbi:MAG TPA: hypothetical protein VFM81_08875 [Actinomycetota bacterium]|nr:hypothetical protein [Actinomycetota bacterium]